MAARIWAEIMELQLASWTDGRYAQSVAFCLIPVFWWPFTLPALMIDCVSVLLFLLRFFVCLTFASVAMNLANLADKRRCCAPFFY